MNLANLAVSIARRIAAERIKKTPRALVIPPALPGSLGDAAMISASIRRLKEEYDSVDFVFGKEWKLDEAYDRRIAAEKYFYKSSILQRAFLISKLANYNNVSFIGADVIDGTYNPRSVCRRLSILKEASRLGIRATVLGSSYNSNPEESTMAQLKRLPSDVVICARDPASRKRMENALERPIRQTADLAFLLNPLPENPDAVAAIDWIKAQRENGSKVIGLNANYLHAAKHPATPLALAKLLKQLLDRGLSIVMVPHDVRTEKPDQRLLSEAANTMSKEFQSRIFMMLPRSPGAIKAVLGELDFLVSGRMHAAILAMGMGTPAFCFAYQDKFEGLFSFFDLQHDELLSAPELLVNDSKAVGRAILEGISKEAKFRVKIKAALPHVFNLANANFT